MKTTPYKVRNSRVFLQRAVAFEAVDRATPFAGSALLLPRVKPIMKKIGTTPGSILPSIGYAGIVQEHTGLVVIHDGLVAADLAGTPPPDVEGIEEAALSLSREDLAGLVGRLSSHMAEVSSADPRP